MERKKAEKENLPLGNQNQVSHFLSNLTIALIIAPTLMTACALIHSLSLKNYNHYEFSINQNQKTKIIIGNGSVPPICHDSQDTS